ncbi:MAG: O-antigen ligase domain-containing protein [Neisseria sp.]|nr:O-antigen ligase domain-containing protein [Neisseria sp.]
MKIKSLTLYTFLAYAMLAAYMLGPTLFYRIGIPRIDNPATLLFILLSFAIFILENKRLPRKIAAAQILLAVMGGWSLLHIIFSSITAAQFADLMMFAILPSYFYILYLIISRHPDNLGFIRRFIIFFTICISLPTFIELVSGFQFVAGNEALSLDSGTLKGLFFNPNNLATTALCLTPAVLIFFNLADNHKKSTLLGWLLFLLLGAVIFASVSRTAIACYLLLLLLTLAYRRNGLTTALVLAAFGMLLWMIPSRLIQDFLLSLNGNEFLERFSSRVYLFLYELESDNSVSYRQEIYNYFWHNPPLLYTGYGPKNFGEYFGGHISSSLGFENPHSFLIELYLGFGLISFAAFLGYVLLYIMTCLYSRTYSSKLRFIAICSMGIFLIAGFIPSTILRLPFIWLPCFLIFIYVTSRQSRFKPTGINT